MQQSPTQKLFHRRLIRKLQAWEMLSSPLVFVPFDLVEHMILLLWIENPNIPIIFYMISLLCKDWRKILWAKWIFFVAGFLTFLEIKEQHLGEGPSFSILSKFINVQAQACINSLFIWPWECLPINMPSSGTLCNLEKMMTGHRME